MKTVRNLLHESRERKDEEKQHRRKHRTNSGGHAACVLCAPRNITDVTDGCLPAAPGHRTARRSTKALKGSRRKNDHTVELLILYEKQVSEEINFRYKN